MEIIEITVQYAGAPIEVKLYPEENFLGTLYPVEMEGKYSFTLSYDEDDTWSVLREPNGRTPEIDAELFNKILKNLQHRLRYAA